MEFTITCCSLTGWEPKYKFGQMGSLTLMQTNEIPENFQKCI